MTIPICPHCGKSNLYAKARILGSAIEYFDEEGESDGIDLSNIIDGTGLRFYPSKTVRCGECKKIRRDLTVVDGRVVKRQE